MSKLELGVSLNCLGVVGVRHGRNEWRLTISIVGFDFHDISVGSDTGDPGLDADFLTQGLGE